MAQREKVIVEFEDKASAGLKKTGTQFDQFFGGIKKAAAAAGLAVAADQILRIGAASVKMAVDAGEARAAFETTYGRALPRASEFVEEFANKAGFATYELEQMLAVTGNVVQGIGATEAESAELAISMATLAGDVASFSNAAGGAEAVLAALQSAINGEREALKTYGLAISETEVQQRALTASGKERVDELTRLEKAEATVAIAYEKAGKAVGDLDRTQDSAANQMREFGAMVKELQVDIGAKLIPALEKALPVLKDLIPVIGDVASGIIDTVTAIEPLLDALGLLTGFYTDMRADQIAMTESEDEMTAGFGRLFRLLTGSGLQSLQYIGTVIDDVGNSFNRTTDQADLLGQASDKNARAHVRVAEAAEEAGDAMVTNYAKALPEVKNLTTELLLAAEAGENLADVMLAQADPLFAAVDAWQSYQEAEKEARKDGKVTAEEQIELLEEQLRLAAALGDLDPQGYENAMLAIQTATGMSREEVERLLEKLGLLEDIKPVVEITIQETVVSGGARRSSTGGSRPGDRTYAYDDGGIVPGPTGRPYDALVHGGEEVLSVDDRHRMVDLLAQIANQGGAGGSTPVQISIAVYPQPGADGKTIARDIEAALASSTLVRRLPERIRGTGAKQL